ncbi:transcription factor [Clostridium sardiniense]|uniref:Transcription factor n=1 Tax=Clostridium sardiniense TaxID=29369 RepID=A0ABS7KW92_CLOSR|nr:transcription factor [Clostridium sardiniense]MBY0755060.1 transcription factor [Clostridium sardiniense]MDQ0459082.1 hypothetical protein [Clostridium sardiniense]
MDKTMISRNSLAERWDLDSNTIYRYEKDGIITRNPNIPTPRYSLEEIVGIEEFEKNPMSPYERRQLNSEISKLKRENEELREFILKISSFGVEGLSMLNKFKEKMD